MDRITICVKLFIGYQICCNSHTVRTRIASNRVLYGAKHVLIPGNKKLQNRENLDKWKYCKCHFSETTCNSRRWYIKHIAMQYNNEECIDLLKKLITANKDRIIGYSKAIEFLDKDKDADLVIVFEVHTQQSQQFKAQLSPLVIREGEVESSHQHDRIVFSNPMESDIKLGAAKRTVVLEACKKGEQELQLIYDEITQCNEMIEAQIKEVITSQSKLIHASYTTIVHLLESEQNK